MAGFLAALFVIFVCGAWAQDVPKFSSSEIDEMEFSKETSLEQRGGLKEVKFFLFTRHTLTNPEFLTIEHARRQGYRNFNPRNPTKVLIHGWLGHENSNMDKTLKEAFLPALDLNVIVVDWNRHGSSSLNYASARNNVDEVADHVAGFLMSLCRQYGLRLESLHLLGHSLGAHIAGLAGVKVKGGLIGRITGFDPAGPMFDAKNPTGRLSRASAVFVDVIHTCGNMLGMKEAIGHVDFYPNSGNAFQPGCGPDVTGSCSHSRSYKYYAESVLTPSAFPAIRCENWDAFKARKCSHDIATMGEYVQRGARGSFFLQTNTKPPFGKHNAYGYRSINIRPKKHRYVLSIL